MPSTRLLKRLIIVVVRLGVTRKVEEVERPSVPPSWGYICLGFSQGDSRTFFPEI